MNSRASLSAAIGTAAVVGFCFALLVHQSTLAGIEIEEEHPELWLLWGGCGLVYLSGQGQLDSPMARWRWMLIYGAVIYALANLLLVYLQFDGFVQARGGKYLLVNDSHVVRTLSLGEYQLRRQRELQVVSAVWLVCYLYMALFHLRRRAPVVAVGQA